MSQPSREYDECFIGWGCIGPANLTLSELSTANVLDQIIFSSVHSCQPRQRSLANPWLWEYECRQVWAAILPKRDPLIGVHLSIPRSSNLLWLPSWIHGSRTSKYFYKHRLVSFYPRKFHLCGLQWFNFGLISVLDPDFCQPAEVLYWRRGEQDGLLRPSAPLVHRTGRPGPVFVQLPILRVLLQRFRSRMC